MPNRENCRLCSSPAELFKNISGRLFYICTNCQSVFLDPEQYLTPAAEKIRYLKHNNNVEDPGYQNFVRPIVNAVKTHFNKAHQGLDFGSGADSAAAKMLRDSGYKLYLFDPFFRNESANLKKTYDFIICCEVIEHFANPGKEFKLLRSLLNDRGKLFCMTSVYSSNIDFENWYYKNDPTHVFFYRQTSLELIKTNYNFSQLKIDGSLIEFTA